MVVCLLCAVAAADDRPWAKGIPKAQQDRALAVYKDGNALFEQSEYKEALAKYEEALKDWKHPAIYFNAAVCLDHLDRKVDAFEFVHLALAFGEEPLGSSLYVDALKLQERLSHEVTELEVTCKQEQAKVSLDGKPLVSCPGVGSRHILVRDDHQLVGEKPGFETKSVPIKLEPGPITRLEVELNPLPRGKLVRRWDRILPFEVIIAGGVVALGGIYPTLRGRDWARTWDGEVERACPSGCLTSDAAYKSTLHAKNVADDWGGLGVGLFIGGGAVIAGGVLMIVLNQPHLEKPQVTPVVGPDRLGATFTTRF